MFPSDAAVEWRLAGASTGVALTTNAAYVQFPLGTRAVILMPRNFSTAVVARFGISPYLAVLRTNNGGTAFTDESTRAQDSDAATHVTMSSFPTLANGGYLLIGAARRFRGVRVDMDAQVNGTASVLTVAYWNGSAWTDLSASDGTASAGASFAQDGLVTWTVPAAWTRASIPSIYATLALAHTNIPSTYKADSLFWTRWVVSAAFDSSTLVDAMQGLTESTAYGELTTGQALQLGGGQSLHNMHRLAGLEALTDAGTANLVVNCGAGSQGFA